MKNINLVVMDFSGAQLYKPDHSTAVISIMDPEEPDLRFKNGNVFKVLHLRFDDIILKKEDEYFNDSDMEECPDNSRPFTKKDAGRIIKFVKICRTAGVKYFLIHCHAGIRRSPGVAVALNEVYNGITTVPGPWKQYSRQVYKMIIQSHKLMR